MEKLIWQIRYYHNTLEHAIRCTLLRKPHYVFIICITKKEIEDNHRQEAMWINSYVENENDVIICRMIFIATIMKNDIY